MAKKKEGFVNEIDRKEMYLKELVEMYSVLDENKMILLRPHLQQIAFLRVKLELLQDKINETGVIEEYQNGENQHGMKISAALKSYNDTVKSFIQETKFVEAYLPAEKKVSKLSAL